jgi:ParB family chromosome partitioning protein
MKIDEQEVIRVTEILDHPEVPNVRSTITKENTKELQKSIKERGVKNPIVVFKQDDKYYIVSGFRRRFALLNLHEEDPKNKQFLEISVIVRKYNRDNLINEALFDNFIENVQREDVAGIDLAERLKMLIDKGINKLELQKQLSKSITWINETLKFLEDANQDVKDMVRSGKISLDEGKKLGKLPKESQTVVAAGLAHVNETGDKKRKKEIKDAVERATRVRSGKSPSKKLISKIRDQLSVLLKVTTDPKEKSAFKNTFAILEWVLGNTDKVINLDPYLKKYNVEDTD